MLVVRQMEEPSVIPRSPILCVSRDTGKVGKDNDMRTNNPYIRRCDCVNHRLLHPVQGLERGREGGEVRVMSCIRI